MFEIFHLVSYLIWLLEIFHGFFSFLSRAEAECCEEIDSKMANGRILVDIGGCLWILVDIGGCAHVSLFTLSHVSVGSLQESVLFSVIRPKVRDVYLLTRAAFCTF